MTQLEDLIIDQLYFVTPFSGLGNELELADEKLGAELWTLIAKGWVKCFIDPETEIQVTADEFKNNFRNYHYLASKQGLLEHNRR